MKYVEVGQESPKGQKALSIIILLVFGSITTILALYMHKADKEFFKTAIPTQGTITRIQTSGSRKHRNRNAYVSYKIDGQVYERNLGYYSSGMRERDSVEVWYQPYNPGNIKSKKGSSMGIWMLGGMGVFCLLMVVWILVQTVKGRGGTNDGN